ncbi:MAG: ankyrin repeat domain-containing protein [Bacteroidales bacterium]|jgi:ankyrin repeat protein|nr:ankyrin repeat domain-containing protein [Bacteroidales bacterium]
MKKVLIIVSFFACIAHSCGQATNKQVAGNPVYQTDSTTQPDNVIIDVYSQLIEAIKTNDQSSFDTLIKQIPVIDSLVQINENENYYSLLGYACKYRCYDFAQKLINLKADVEIGKADDYLVFDALSVAVQSEDLHLVKLLLDNGANPNRMNSEEGFTVLSLSCILNNYDITKLLIEKGAKVDGLGYTEGTDYVHYPLLDAVESNNIKLVQLLIDNNCKIDIQDKQGNTPFSIAKHNNNQQIYDLLLEAEASF